MRNALGDKCITFNSRRKAPYTAGLCAACSESQTKLLVLGELKIVKSGVLRAPGNESPTRLLASVAPRRGRGSNDPVDQPCQTRRAAEGGRWSGPESSSEPSRQGLVEHRVRQKRMHAIVAPGPELP